VTPAEQREVNAILWELASPATPEPTKKLSLTDLLLETKELARLWRNGTGGAEISPRILLKWKQQYSQRQIRRAMRLMFSRHFEDPLSPYFQEFHTEIMLGVPERFT
jgi:hypothetical protein